MWSHSMRSKLTVAAHDVRLSLRMTSPLKSTAHSKGQLFVRRRKTHVTIPYLLATVLALAICVRATWSYGDQAGGGAGGSGGAGGGVGRRTSAAQARPVQLDKPALPEEPKRAQVKRGAGQAGTGATWRRASLETIAVRHTDIQDFGVGRRPFFANPTCSRQLGLDDNRFNRFEPKLRGRLEHDSIRA